MLRSADIERAARFYGELGIQFTRHIHTNSGPEHVHLTSALNGLIFEIYPLASLSSPTAGLRLGFRVDSVDDMVNMLAGLGAIIVTRPTDTDWGRRAVIKDFDGHFVELVTQTDS